MKVPRLQGKRGEDFALYTMRRKSVLTGKDVWSVVDPFGEHLATDEAKKKGSKALMYIFNSLGDDPLRTASKEGEEDPRKLWQRLDTRFASTTETAHITVAESLANKSLKPGGD